MNMATALLLLPELTLGLGAVLVLLADAIGSERRARGVETTISLVAITCAALATGALWGTTATALSGMLAVDPLAVYMKLIACASGFLVLLACRPYIDSLSLRGGEFHFLVLLAVLAMMLATAANDLISLYLAFEFLSLTSYVLVAYLRGRRISLEAGIKYFLYGAVTSAFMLYGMSLLYGATGTTNIESIAQKLRLATYAQQWFVVPLAILLLAGFSFKVAIAPFHQWAPDAYEGGPTPIVALLSVASKATGFGVLMRVMVVAMGDLQPTWARVLGAFAIVSMVLGNLVAVQQSDIKRMLAYSGIGHAGYIMIGVVTFALGQGQFGGLSAALLYLVAYLFTNVGAFLAIQVVENAVGSTAIKSYAGLVHRSPLLAGMLAYFLFSLTGIPLTGGMWAKLAVFGSAMRAGSFGLTLALIGIATSVVAAYYYLNVVRQMFVVPAAEVGPARLQVPVAVTFALGLAAAATLLIGIFPQPLMSLATLSASMMGALLY